MHCFFCFDFSFSFFSPSARLTIIFAVLFSRSVLLCFPVSHTSPAGRAQARVVPASGGCICSVDCVRLRGSVVDTADRGCVELPGAAAFRAQSVAAWRPACACTRTASGCRRRCCFLRIRSPSSAHQSESEQRRSCAHHSSRCHHAQCGRRTDATRKRCADGGKQIQQLRSDSWICVSDGIGVVTCFLVLYNDIQQFDLNFNLHNLHTRH